MFTPLNWFFICLILFAILKNKRWKKIFGWLAVFIFLIFSSPLLFQYYARWWQPKPVLLPEQSHYSFAIVAGGFGSVDATGEGYFNSSSDRFLQAVRLFHTGTVDHILISGGNSKKNDKNFSEGSWAKGEMIEMGVPANAIFVEDASNGTKTNAVNSKRILDSIHAKPPFVLITSAFHIPRATKIFQDKGLQVLPFPCNYTEGRGPLSAKDLIPDFGIMMGWSKYIKETLWWILKG